MDNRLYQSGYLAIPIKANENNPLFPQPNWMVIENIFGKLTATLPVLGETLCKQSVYKLVFREILLANEELGRAEQMNEIIYENTNQPIPAVISGAFDTHEILKTYINEVNQMLSLFQFRGKLQGFVLEVDETALAAIIESKTPPVIEEEEEEETPTEEPPIE